MARYRADDASERRTKFLGIWLAPGEHAELESAAAGVPISAYARAMLFSRSAAAAAVTQRNPEAAGLMRELSAIGNNLNQIARHLNTTGELDDWDELRQALEWLKPAIGKVIDL